MAGSDRATLELPRERVVPNPLSLTRVDSAIARSAAGFGVAFFAQSVPLMVEQLPNLHPAWSIVLVAALVASLVFAIAASVVGRLVRIAQGAFAIVYVAALISWPFAVLDLGSAPATSFWLYFLLTIATATATIAFDVRIATLYVIAVPAIYAVIRITPEGGGVSPTQATLDSVYSIILGGVITIIVTMLRTAASAVDRAQQTALTRYSHAVRQHAIEAERVQVDAIVHDSVLTTLLSAARALTPDAKQLAATMAGNAIGHLRDASGSAPDSDAVVGVGVVASRIGDAASTMSQPFEVRTSGVGQGSVPIAVAEAVYSAAVQAMVNSLQHAGSGVRRWAAVRGEDGGIVVEIGDEGRGFDPEEVPTERLGVRVSILERVASAGGEATLDSAPGEGTRVTLAWPAPAAAAPGEGAS
ncbi:sensor histidine kinase [Homoserinibacter sp. YIM 151385]|uniref:sensor histidine kinase n=1 Tax=Homoserinibacter sp. YIM 151385 TaxID=2985506 RepID=UPI0022F01C23|nr:ATP-binding protein [Homoserinibacter sp. YIM 151385]WBU36802.1 histidine kinase [Homoserinibacter sp. YIM 151385]